MPHQLPRTEKRRLWREMRETGMWNQVPWQSLRSRRLPQMRHNLQTTSLCHPLPSSHSPISLKSPPNRNLWYFRLRNPNARLFAKTPVATGNAPNPTVPNPSASWSVKTPPADLRYPVYYYTHYSDWMLQMQRTDCWVVVDHVFQRNWKRPQML